MRLQSPSPGSALLLEVKLTKSGAALRAMAARADSLTGYLAAAPPPPEPGAPDPGSNSERSADSPLGASEDDGHPPAHCTDPDWVEERFRVDRKKLEAMLQAAAEGKGKSGEDFFQKIMAETSTQIAWPSKLKIGAKSKKVWPLYFCSSSSH